MTKHGNQRDTERNEKEIGVNMKREELGVGAIAFGVGVIVGGILALLYAPASGEETRGAIKSKAVEVARDVRGKFGHGKLDDVIPH